MLVLNVTQSHIKLIKNTRGMDHLESIYNKYFNLDKVLLITNEKKVTEKNINEY